MKFQYDYSNDKNNKQPFEKTILSLSSTDNPAIFMLQDQFKYIDSIEVIKTRIEATENSCEFYRNCPFIVLFDNFKTIIAQNNTHCSFFRELGLSSNITYDSLCDTLNSMLINRTQTTKLPRKFNYSYKSTTSTLDDVQGTLCNGIAPYVLNNIRYSYTSLINALNTISLNYYIDENCNVPLIITERDSNSGQLYFTADTPFVLFPSNAFKVVGLSPDHVYVSVFEYALNKFIVRTNFKPCLTGADTVYIMNEESKFTNNPLYSSLDTVYFLSEDYPSYDQRTIPIFHRKLQMNSDYVNKLTIALYTNLETKTLYQNHNRKWFIDIVVSGWI